MVGSEQFRRYYNPATGYRWHEVGTVVDGAPQTVKVIDAPGVYLVAYSCLHEGYINHFLRDHDIKNFQPWGDPADGQDGRNARGTDDELLVELAGRICYMSYDKPRPGGLDAFVQNLKAEGHGSVFEHPHYSFVLSGVSRNLTLEANRHRPFSISQLSGRFVNPDEVGFIGDPDHAPDEAQAFAEDCVRAFRRYEARYERNHARFLRKWSDALGALPPNTATPPPKDARRIVKKARERARDILPGALETRVLYTVNTRAIRFVIEKRCHADAAWEIRRAFNKVFRVLAAHDPRLFADFTETDLGDGTFAVSTPYPKV